MFFLIGGLLLFYGVHLVPSFVGLRSALIERLGKWPYLGIYALLSGIGVALVVLGMSQAERTLLWQAPPWGHALVVAVMLPVFFLFVAVDMRSNLKRYVRHPMLLGVVVWSICHLLVNGNLPAVLLFGSLLLYALFAMVSANRRGARLQREHYPVINDVKVIVAGISAYMLFLWLLHPYVIRVAVV